MKAWFETSCLLRWVLKKGSSHHKYFFRRWLMLYVWYPAFSFAENNRSKTYNCTLREMTPSLWPQLSTSFCWLKQSTVIIPPFFDACTPFLIMFQTSPSNIGLESTFAGLNAAMSSFAMRMPAWSIRARQTSGASPPSDRIGICGSTTQSSQTVTSPSLAFRNISGYILADTRA